MRRLCALLLVAAAALHVAGCSEQRLADERAAMRTGRAGRTVHAVVHKERTGPERLERTVGLFGRRVQLDADRTERDRSAAEAAIRGEFDRWGADQERYRQWLEELLRGKAETMERNAINLFY